MLEAREAADAEMCGTNTQFTTNDSEPMEFCLDDQDRDLTNNNGGFDVTISVDQSGPGLRTTRGTQPRS